jgi:hypothetical protein
VTSVCYEHNHHLSPQQVRFFRCNKDLDLVAKSKLEINDKAGIRMNKNYNSLTVKEGYDNLAYREKDYRNFIAKSRRLCLGIEGAKALRGYFSIMQELNDGFYFERDLDDKCRLRNMFSADARSRASYKDFRDVITFETTYLTNR